jgi:hypothetical protein
MDKQVAYLLSIPGTAVRGCGRQGGGGSCALRARPLGKLDSVVTGSIRAKMKQADTNFCLHRLGIMDRGLNIKVKGKVVPVLN